MGTWKDRISKRRLLMWAVLALLVPAALVVRLVWTRHTGRGGGAATPGGDAEETALAAAVSMRTADPRPSVQLARYYLARHRAWDALDTARAAALRFPESVPVRLTLADAQLAVGAVPEATATLEPLGRIDPRYRVQAAEYLAGSGEFEPARRTLARIPRGALSADADLAFRAARVYGNALQPEAAIPLLREAAKARSRSKELQTYLGSALLTTGRYGEAVPVLRDALSADPEDAPLRFHLGVALRLAGERPALTGALEHLRKALELDANGRMFVYERGRTQLAASLNQAAVETLRVAAEQTPALPEVQRDLGAAYERTGRSPQAAVCRSRFYLSVQDFPAAIAALEPFYRRSRRDPSIALAMAQAYLEARRLNQAHGVLRTLREAAPRDPAVLWELYRTLRSLAKNEEALLVLDELAAVTPDDVRVLEEKSETLQTLTRYPEAEAVLTELQRREPDQAFRYYQLGLFQILWLQRADRERTAEQNLRRAIELNPGFAGPRYRLGVLLSNTGRNEEAVLQLRRALGISPRFSDALRALGRAYLRLGDDAHSELAFRLYRRLAAEEAERKRLEQPARYRRATAADRFPLARFYLRTGDLRAATVELEVLTHSDPGNRAALELLSRLYGMANRYQRTAEVRQLLNRTGKGARR